jgi:ABC-type transport system involved in multi-copper enzyme maturation permease subunit
MTPVLLIAANFLREQRWLVLVLVLYAGAMAAIFGISEKEVSPEDIAFFLRQQSVYAPLFSVFLAVTAIHNERKSRRIVAVLSKALTRSQYIAGLLVGIFVVFGVYCVAIALAGTWLAHNAHSSVAEVWSLLAMTTVASALTAAVAMFFGTFLPPILAAAATALAIVLPAILETFLGREWGLLLPIYSLLTRLFEKTSARASGVDWPQIAIGVIEIPLFWVLASWIFSGRDVTTAVE